MQLTCTQSVNCNVASWTAGNGQLVHAASQRSLRQDNGVMDDASTYKHTSILAARSNVATLLATLPLVALAEFWCLGSTAFYGTTRLIRRYAC